MTPPLKKVLGRDLKAGMRVWARRRPDAEFEPGEVQRVEYRRTAAFQRQIVAAVLFDADANEGCREKWWVRPYTDIRTERT